MAKRRMFPQVTKYQDGFARGLCTCSDMLAGMDADECAVPSQYRSGRPQDNAVRRTLGEVLMRGGAAELDGFCGALTEIAALADENGDYCRGFAHQARRREFIMRRVVERNRTREVAHG
jgi:hypothetical protein